MGETSTTADSIFRCEPAPAGSSPSVLEDDAPGLAPLQSLSPDLKIYTPSEPTFKALNTYFNLDLTPNPLAIIRPTTNLQVSQIIHFATTHSVTFTVRAGGHDSWGRSAVTGALIIDLRELDSIVLAEDKKSVTIGGGTISENLTKFLAPHGLVAVQGGCSSVGYTNWAACGGYSSLNGSFGLGCDQIVGARIVNAGGEIVDADEETLWGLRGGGCNFGVVVTLDVRVHRLEKVLAGLVVFPIIEAKEVLMGYREVLKEGFPDAYGGLMGLLAIPGMGTVLMFMFTWSSGDLEAGWEFLGKLRRLGKVVMDTVKETTLAGWTEVGKAFSPTSIYTNIRMAYVKDLSESLIDLLLNYIGKIPAGTRAMFIVHIVHGQAVEPIANSCFGTREPHVWVGIHGQTSNESNKCEAYTWADAVVDDLKGNGLMMKGGYVAQMGDNEPIKECFGENWERLKDLKRKLDQTGVFRHAVPPLLQ